MSTEKEQSKKAAPNLLEFYWDRLKANEKKELAESVSKSVESLRQIFKYGRPASGALALEIEEYTRGYIPRQVLRADLYPPPPRIE